MAAGGKRASVCNYTTAQMHWRNAKAFLGFLARETDEVQSGTGLVEHVTKKNLQKYFAWVETHTTILGRRFSPGSVGLMCRSLSVIIQDSIRVIWRMQMNLPLFDIPLQR